MKLGQLEGLPNRIINNQCSHCKIDYFKVCKSEYDSLDLRLDVEEMAQIMFKSSYKSYGPSERIRIYPSWELSSADTKRRYRNMAKAISDNVAKIVKVGK